jgi:hypothetical protein
MSNIPQLDMSWTKKNHGIQHDDTQQSDTLQ